MQTNHKLPSPFISLLPIVILVAFISCVIYNFGSNALTGASQVVLLTVSAVVVTISMLMYGVKWKSHENAIVKNVSGVVTAILILLLIGSLSGSWMISGIVPTMISYGVQIISPRFFLVSSCIISALVSIMTGSSWTTIATIGIALMGIGNAEGFSDGWTAGAIISGAYFGDKVSPLSDTTVLASSSTDTPLFTHIKYMMLTTIPTIVVTLIIFTVAGLILGSSRDVQVSEYTEGLAAKFIITPWLLLVPIATGVMIALRWPSIIVLFISAGLGAFAAFIAQPHLLAEIGMSTSEEMPIFSGIMTMLFGPTAIDTGNAGLNELVATRGMGGMMNTIWLIVCAMVFGGVMTASGMLESLMRYLLKLARSTVGLVTSTASVGFMLNIACADQYLAIILTANMFKDSYKYRGYESRLLSRSIEDSTTVTSVLVPWNTCGMTQSTVLGVATFTYLPYCFFCLLSPLTTIITAAVEYKINRKPNDNVI